MDLRQEKEGEFKVKMYVWLVSVFGIETTSAYFPF